MPRISQRIRTIGAPLADVSIRRLWYARAISEVGDWAAVLALGVLVFAQTRNPLAAAAVTTVSLLPHLGVGQLLGTLADRYPHRTVMALSEVWRGTLYLVLAFTDLPVPYVLALAFLAGMADPPFQAALNASLPLLSGERYLSTLTLWTTTRQAMSLVGFAVGGLLVAATSPSAALALNGATFLVGAVLIVKVRPTRSSETAERRPLIRPAVRALTSDRLIVVSASAVTFAAVLGVSVESLVVPYAAHLGFGAAGAGALATVPAAAALASALLIPATGEDTALVRLVCLMVGGMSSVAITVFLVDSPMPFVLIGFLAAGALDVLTVPAGAVIGKRLPQASRGTAFSFLEGTLALSQAGGAVLAGILATATSVPQASAILALPGLATACIGLALIRGRRAVRASATTPVSREPLALESAPALAD